MSASTVQLRLHNGQNHNSSLTFYSHGREAKPALSRRLADAKSGGNIDILPTKMTNGFSGGIRKSFERKEQESEKERRSRSKSKTYVSCLQTSLSFGWKKSLSVETDDSDFCEPDNDHRIIDMDGSLKKESPTVKESEKKIMKGTEHRKTVSEEQKSQKAKPRTSDEKAVNATPLRSRSKGKRSELQDAHVSVQPSTGRQLMIISNLENGAVSVTTYGDGSPASPKSCTSYVYIKSKFQGNQYSKTKRSTVVVQKPPLCRSITISEASLSSALSRQADKMAPQSRSNTNLRKERSWTGINVQRKSKRSFTVSNDSTDGRLRTIYESTMEENCD
ncbi:uncharacterized protein LOC116300223 [Actinia tenebrosa]|uniref:Uncharacterized protein LOC116300223 n=1 Tax=Actinia tenebrosa TaxID=6105 RepID=A0A6P8IBX7_ACTTE|nr:uncharacterized protein LOC116300223 [Actinia tenebrosa]